MRGPSRGLRTLCDELRQIHPSINSSQSQLRRRTCEKHYIRSLSGFHLPSSNSDSPHACARASAIAAGARAGARAGAGARENASRGKKCSFVLLT